jgi:two-component system, OmpR family, phosphate regulon response regulator OmpR
MAEKAHILVIDDDRRIRELLKGFLGENGYRVTLAFNAADARDKLESLAFDIIILDVMMPGEDGLAFAASMREKRNDTPILMLSALAESQHRIRGLSTGSDDYLGKPFEPVELLLRLRNLLRRNARTDAPPSEVKFGDYTFHVRRGELRHAESLVRLTTRERGILRQLAERAGTPLSRDDLAPSGSGAVARGVDVQINRLRQKIEVDPANPVYLQTVRGAGYVLHVLGS